MSEYRIQINQGTTVVLPFVAPAVAPPPGSGGETGDGHTHSNKAILDAITVAYTTGLNAKLSGIETGATADQTGAEIVALIDAELETTSWQTGGVGGDFLPLAGGTLTGVLLVSNTLVGFRDDQGQGLKQVDLYFEEDNFIFEGNANVDAFVFTRPVFVNASAVVLESRSITAGTGLTGGGTLAADRTVSLSSTNVDKLAALTVSDDKITTVDRAFSPGLFDHTIAAGEDDAPPAGAIFRSTVDGLIYHRTADGSTHKLDNDAVSEYGGGSLLLGRVVVAETTTGDASTPEVQTVTVYGTGNYKIGDGVTQTTVASDASVATMQTAIDAAFVGASVVSGDPGGYTLTWQANGARDLVTITDATLEAVPGTAAFADASEFARVDLVQTWTANQIPGSSAISFASEITDDLDANGLVRTLTLTGDVTTFAVSNGTNYQIRRYYILQDATGGHTITFSGIDGTEPTIDTAANALTVFEIEFIPGTGARFV